MRYIARKLPPGPRETNGLASPVFVEGRARSIRVVGVGPHGRPRRVDRPLRGRHPAKVPGRKGVGSGAERVYERRVSLAREALAWLVYLLPIGQRRHRLFFRWKLTYPQAIVRGYLRRRIRGSVGVDPDFAHPRRFTELLQVYKFEHRDPRFAILADKYRVRAHLEAKGYGHLLVPLRAVGRRFEDIDLEGLPDAFVVKVNHDSGGVFVVRDKHSTDFESMRREVNARLALPYVRAVELGEWNYVHIDPRVIVEDYLEDASGNLRDYKVHCFGGEPVYVQVDADRFEHHTRAFYDLDWNRLDFALGFPRSPTDVDRPTPLESMLQACRELSADFPYVRIDFYCVGDRLYFGEFTFFHGSGVEAFDPDERDFEFGQRLRAAMKKPSTRSPSRDQVHLPDVVE